jgi:hypothetical protein
MKSNCFDIHSLSPHLFWDVDMSTLNMDTSSQFIVKRILEYGLLSDWIQLYKYLGINKIANVAMEIRDLDPKAVTFLSALSNKPKEQFKCYTTQQSMPQHWNF